MNLMKIRLYLHEQTSVLYFPTLGEPPVNRKDLIALTLVGHSRDNPVYDPLDVVHLDNQLYT